MTIVIHHLFVVVIVHLPSWVYIRIYACPTNEGVGV